MRNSTASMKAITGRQELARAELVERASNGWRVPPRNADHVRANTSSSATSAIDTASETPGPDTLCVPAAAEPSSVRSSWMVEVLDLPAPLDEHYDTREDADGFTPRRVHTDASGYMETLRVSIPMWHDLDSDIAAVEAATENMIQRMSN